MNNYTKIINQMKEKIVTFSKNLSIDLSKPNRKFVLNLIYGLICSSSSYLSEIARSLKENITLKKTIERLSNNLTNFDKEKRDYVWNNYVDKIKDKIDDNTVFCFDPGDLGKKNSKKLENLDLIKDGSTGEYINGYKMIEVAALTRREKLPIPVYSSLYSTKDEDFISENDECLTALKYIRNKFGNMGIYALDRGFDDEKYFKYFSNNDLSFVIRMTVIGFIAIFSDNQKYAQYIIVFEAAKSLRTNDKIVLVYYAVERGLNKIFNNDKNGIKKLYSSETIKTESEQCILPEFSNFNCFIN